jgi:hypothetical protein
MIITTFYDVQMASPTMNSSLGEGPLSVNSQVFGTPDLNCLTVRTPDLN